MIIGIMGIVLISVELDYQFSQVLTKLPSLLPVTRIIYNLPQSYIKGGPIRYLYLCLNLYFNLHLYLYLSLYLYRPWSWSLFGSSCSSGSPVWAKILFSPGRSLPPSQKAAHCRPLAKRAISWQHQPTPPSPKTCNS